MSGVKSRQALGSSLSPASPYYCIPCKEPFQTETGLQQHIHDSPKHAGHPVNRPEELQSEAREQLRRHHSPSYLVATPHDQTIPDSLSKPGRNKRKQKPRRASSLSSDAVMYMTKADNTKGENRQAPPTLLSDQGYSPKESTHDDADSSAEDLLIGTSLSAAGSSSIMVRLPARAFAVDEDESEDESAYFTSEETSVPPQELLQAYKGRNFEHSHGITVSQASSVPSASNLGQGRSVNPHTSNGDLVSHQIDETSYRNGIPIRSTSRNSSVITQPTNVPIPWDEILHSDIPRDIYETSDTGGIRCLTCARWFENFRNFKRHYQQSRRHQEPISSTEHSTSGKDTQNGPPPLIRVPSEDAISSRNTRSSLYETMSTNSRTPGSSVRRQQTKFPCKPCRQVFADITALHSHKSAAVHAHPYYCRSCCIEYVNFEALQTHYENSAACLTGEPSIHEEAMFSYQDYQAAQLPANYHTADMVVPLTLPNTSKQVQSQNDGISLEDMPICPICITPLTDVTDVTATFCGHVFCAPCILEHLRTRNSCPRCRKLISSMMLIPLFF